MSPSAGPTDMSLTIAPLHPADVDEAVSLHQRAFPEFFLSQLGTGFLRQFYSGFLTDPTAVTTVARDEQGRIVGTVVGTTHPSGFFGRLLRRRLGGFALASASAALRSPRVVPRLVKGITYRGEAGERVDGALLSSICVAPDAQGAGVGRQIIEAWCDSARERGATRAFLTTDALDNHAVNAFYTRRGWECTATFSTDQGRSMNRYEKELA